VDVPAYFEGKESNGVLGYQAGADPAFAALPGMINLLNVDGTLIVPDPMFTEFRTAFEQALGPGTSIQWIDCLEYHWRTGEVHCGTNVRRTPGTQVLQWWTITP
jgi:hypothetical protein